MIQGTDGAFYGTTYTGGTLGAGTIFRLSTGLGAFVRPVPTSGKVGSTVQILGTGLAGPASVTFNGTPAVITAATPSAITVAVPAGATSGKIRVTQPGGTLSSNIAFRVLQ